MAQPSTQDIVNTVDLTGLAKIEASDINQIVATAIPVTDKGLNVVTTDIATVPQVPAAQTNTKWQQYTWVRRTATIVLVYFWNPVASSDATFLKWQPLSISNIPDGSITDAMLAGDITKDKILSLSWSQLEDIPPLTATGVASGDLQGTYPAPTIKPNAVDSTKLSSDAVTDANRAVGTNAIKDKNVTAQKIADHSLGAPQLLMDLDLSTLTSVTLPAATIAALLAMFVTTRHFASAEVNIASGKVIDVAHGLGAKPTIVRGVLVCKTINLVYAVGDEVDATVNNGSSDAPAIFIGANSTNVWLIVRSTFIAIAAKDNSSFADITNGDWKLKIYANL